MKNHSIFIVLLMSVGYTTPASAQQDEQDKHQPANAGLNESFESFRKGLHSGFDNFRNDLLKNYDRFLGDTWSKFESFRGIDRYPRPKPERLPRPEETVPMGSEVEQTPVIPSETPPVASPHDPAVSLAEDDPSAGTPSATTPNGAPAEKDRSAFAFRFYDLECNLPGMERMEWKKCPTGRREKDYAARWRWFEQAHVAETLLPHLKTYMRDHQLNDWLAVELVRAYVNSRLSEATSAVRISLSQYLLAYLGIDARIAQTSDGHPFLMLPFNQTIYARTFLVQDGTKFYLFADKDAPFSASDNPRYYTYSLPANVPHGRAIDPTIHKGLNLPAKPCRFSIEYGGLKITGEWNRHLKSVLYRYPQMELSSYANSTADERLRASIVRQLKSQLSGKSTAEAVNSLLQFVQHAFDYATDDRQHGFEKPYFFEELLFYPQCDCEDRSVFYSYLLKEVLALECHIISYPGHACVSVCLNNESGQGTYYVYQGNPFYISDPTYIGAVTGMCMPQFKDESPVIEWLSEKE